MRDELCVCDDWTAQIYVFLEDELRVEHNHKRRANDIDYTSLANSVQTLVTELAMRLVVTFFYHANVCARAIKSERRCGYFYFLDSFECVLSGAVELPMNIASSFITIYRSSCEVDCNAKI